MESKWNILKRFVFIEKKKKKVTKFVIQKQNTDYIVCNLKRERHYSKSKIFIDDSNRFIDATNHDYFDQMMSDYH